MIPIFEQGRGKGIGHGLESFLKRFDSICAEHLASKRALAFAFIFYDFHDDALRKILKDQGVFAKLDRLSGEKISIFYLHAGSKNAVAAFNEHFYRTLVAEGTATLPCVVFFRIDSGSIRDIETTQLESSDLIHGFTELYDIVEAYLSRQTKRLAQTEKASSMARKGAQFLSVEIVRAGLRELLQSIM
jgi:hypothetical protein